MTKPKYSIDSNSSEYKKGYQTFLEGHYYGHNAYSGRTEYGKYINFKDGVKEAEIDTKIYGINNVREYNRFSLCLSSVGKSEYEIRKIFKYPVNGIYKHEINAIMLKLFSPSSKPFNVGVDRALRCKEKPKSPYSKIAQYGDYINWHTGYDSTELAIQLHGKKAVMETL